MRKSLPVALLAAGLMLSATACTTASKDSAAPKAPAGASSAPAGVDEAAAKLVPADVKAKGELTFAHDASYAPFEYFDTDNKTIIGFDVDLADAVTAALGLKAKHVNAGFDTILPGISSGKYDVGASAFSVTPERAKSVDFVTYLNGGSGIAVKAGNPQGLSMDPMKLCGHKIAGQKGSIQGLNQLPKISAGCVSAGKSAISIQLYPSQDEANLAVASGRADAVMADSISMAVQAKASKGQFELAPGADYEPAPTGFALSKGSPLDDALSAAMKYVVSSGQMKQIMAKWAIPDSALDSSAGAITK